MTEYQWFLTALSVRPTNRAAMSHHLLLGGTRNGDKSLEKTIKGNGSVVSSGSERKKKNGACVWFCVLCVGKRMKPTTKKKIIPITKKEPWFLKKEMGAYPMRWCASSNMTSSSAVHASLLTLGSK